MAKFVNDDGAFEAGFEQNLSEPVRDYAKGFKTLEDALKSGLESRQGFRERVKIPTDANDRAKFLMEHFSKDLEQRETARKAAEAEEAKKRDATAAEDRAKAAKKQAEDAEKLLKERHGTNFDTNLELVRRAFRGEHVPEWIKVGVAKAAGVDLDKLTDEQIKTVIKTDPGVFETLLTIGRLTADGRTEHGDGHAGGKADEKAPLQPDCPELYAGLPDSDPVKKWFLNRGYEFSGGRYVGRKSG